MDIGQVLKWTVEHYAELSAIGSTLVLIGSKVHRMWPDLPKNSPRLEALQELGAAIWPDVESAMKAIGKLVNGGKPPTPTLPLLLVLTLALAGCPAPLPKKSGCQPHTMVCKDGVPMVCTPGQVWIPSSRRCSDVGAVCCTTGSFHDHSPIITCTRPESCIDRDGGAQ